MMNLEQVKALMPEYARDIKLNLSTVLGGTGTPGLSEAQALGTAQCSPRGRRGDGDE